MESYLVKVPQGSQQSAQIFEGVFIQLHETLLGEKVAFEILADGQNIAFGFSASPAACQIIAGQIYAVASGADIIAISDFTRTFGRCASYMCSELSLKNRDLFPLKDYREFEGDSLSGLLSVLSKLSPDETILVQIVIQARSDSGAHHAQLMIRKRSERVNRKFRPKYWFKREVVHSFNEKIEEKVSSRLYKVNIRAAALSSADEQNVPIRLKAVCGAMSNFNTLDFNQLRIGPAKKNKGVDDFANRSLRSPFLLSTRELATMFHLPPENEVPNLVHVLSRRQPPPRELPVDQHDADISFFGSTNFRSQNTAFGVKRGDRRRHLYTLGKSGTGKSKLLELLIMNDIHGGHGVGVLDPHGDLVDNVLANIPEHRIKDVILFDPSDLEYPPSFNPLEQVAEELKMRVTIGFIEIFKKLFGTNWSPRLEHVLRYTTLALLDSKGTTVLSILKMLSDKSYRQSIVRNIQDDVVKNFWVNEFAGWSEKFDSEAITPLLNKVGQFVSTNMIRNIVGQPDNQFDFRHIMDNRKILLMKISKGILGEENASLLGAMAVTKIYQAAMSRADIPENDRIDFYFYVDEFQNFATDTFDEILSESRKYRLCLTIANQFLGQLSDQIRATVFGNVGSVVSFRVGGEDANILAKEFEPRFGHRDLINLGVRDFCAKISIDGETHEAFSGRTLTMNPAATNFAAQCVDHSRAHYSKPLAEVRNILQRWEEGSEEELNNTAPGTSAIQEEPEFEEPLL